MQKRNIIVKITGRICIIISRKTFSGQTFSGVTFNGVSFTSETFDFARIFPDSFVGPGYSVSLKLG